MKLTEFKNLIREEIQKVLNEADRYEKITNMIGFNPKKVKVYKVGSGSRSGMPVDVDALKQVVGKPLTNIEYIERVGKFKFDTAYANIKAQEPSYRQKFYNEPGSGKTLTYSLFGKDSAGNEFIYDKYEGGTAGGGQALLFVNGKKMQVSQYIYLKGKIKF